MLDAHNLNGSTEPSGTFTAPMREGLTDGSSFSASSVLSRKDLEKNRSPAEPNRSKVQSNSNRSGKPADNLKRTLILSLQSGKEDPVCRIGERAELL